MIEILDTIDKQLLLALNNEYSQFWDGLMYLYSGKLIWIPLYISIVYLLIKKHKREAVWLILGVVLTVAAADFISSGIIKAWVMRPRPSHAANSFGLALIASLILRNRMFGITIFLWATINSYSRIYLGVHYPGDILGGMLVGFFCAAAFYFLIRKWRPAALRATALNRRESLILPLVFLVTLIAISLFSALYF